MINHMRTLLLNGSSEELGLASGVPHSQYIEPAFSPIVLDKRLNSFRTIVMPIGTPAFQNMRVNNLMCILHTKELEPYTLYFDSRCTYSLTNYNLEDADYDTFDISYVFPNLELWWIDPNVRDYLMKVPATWPVSELTTIANEAVDIHLKIGAFILLYCFKCESIRGKYVS